MYSLFQAQKSCEKVDAELKLVQSIVESLDIANIDEEGVVDNVLDQLQNNICVLHKESENLTSTNFSLKIDLDKKKNSIADSEVSLPLCALVKNFRFCKFFFICSQ